MLTDECGTGVSKTVKRNEIANLVMDRGTGGVWEMEGMKDGSVV